LGVLVYANSGGHNASHSTIVYDNRTERNDMTILWKAELTDELIAHLSDADKIQIRRDLDKAVEAVCEPYQVGREFNHD
jgi:hypothetical protein